MKILNLFLLILIIGCSKYQTNDNINNSLNQIPINKNCDSIFQFGKYTLCVPKIYGMHNVIHNPQSKEYIQSKNYPGNMYVAYYVNDKIYKNLEILYDDQFDDFFQIYVTISNTDKIVNNIDLQSINKKAKEYVNSLNWEYLKDKLENLNENNIFEKPIIVESYSLSSNSIQNVTLITVTKDNTQKNMVAIGNMIIVKNRLFYAIYYYYLRNPKSIVEAKKRNDEIMLQVLKLNK
jgi:hypothetical protein